MSRDSSDRWSYSSFEESGEESDQGDVEQDKVQENNGRGHGQELGKEEQLRREEQGLNIDQENEKHEITEKAQEFDQRYEGVNWWEDESEDGERLSWYRDDWPTAGSLTLEDFADSVVPAHIVAPRAYLMAKERARVEDLIRHRSYRAQRQQAPTPKWKVQRADHNGWRRRTLDNQPGSIYDMKDAMLQSMSDEALQLSSEVRIHPYREAADQQQSLERRYIQDASDQAWDGVQGQGIGAGGEVSEGRHEASESKTGGDNVRFTLHIMRRYNKPARDTRDPSYGAPAPSVPGPQKSMVSQLVEGVVRPPSSIHLVHSCVRPMHFQQPISSSFCEVLGPTSCKACIEGTNRYTAHRVENLVFPTLPSLHPGTALVVPKLTHIMARDNRRLTLKTNPPAEGTPHTRPHHSPNTRAKSRERAVTLAIKKTSTKVAGPKKKEVSGGKQGVLLPVISQGMPTLASTHKRKARVHVRLYDRRWEVRAKDFFPEKEENPTIQREDSSLHLSEQQRRLRHMLENIKFKSAIRGAQPP